MGGAASSASSGNTGTGAGNGSTEHTLLLIPGVKVKLYYLSKFTANAPSPAADSTSSGVPMDKHQRAGSFTGDSENLSVSGSPIRPLLSKSATLNASVQVESLSKETIVKPSLLDYLEKAFEPIIMSAGAGSSTGEDGNTSATNMSVDNGSTVGTGSMLSSSGSSLYSFPVDVVVLIRVQPSDIRFSCHPVSKVECLLRIPSLDFAITSTPPNAPPNSALSVGSPGMRRKPTGKPYFRTSVSSSSGGGGMVSLYYFYLF